MIFCDSLTLDAPRRLDGGAFAVRARAARIGHYAYTGAEVDPENKHGLRDKAVVNVLRDENTVFDERAVRSFIGKPITDNHPLQPVTADNWRDHARGTIMGAVRDGDYLAFDLLLTDADAIAKVQNGKRELSNGYTSALEFGRFQAADGTMCDVRQSSIFGNHIAIVDRGRAGPECRIADAAPCEALTPAQLSTLPQLNNDGDRPVKTMLIDGLTVDMANVDTAIATVQTLIAARDTAVAKVGEHVATIAAKDTEIATLKTEKQQLVDAKPTPAQLRDAAKVYAQVVGKAKAVGVDVSDSMDESAIMKAVVTKVMGDAVNGWNDAQIAASFAVATKDAKVDDADTIVPLGDARATANDASARDKALSDRNAHLRDAWKRPVAA